MYLDFYVPTVNKYINQSINLSISISISISDKCMRNYDNIILLGDFNVATSEDIMNDFCQMYELDNLINEPTCYKNVNNPSSIDVMLTNRKSCFQDSITIETGLSDHHKMTLSVLKTFFLEKRP